jgi:transposase
MSRTRLTAEQRSELLSLKDARSTHPKVRRWIEMVLLHAEGWSHERIAAHLGLNRIAVQRRVRRFFQEGIASLAVRYPEGRGNGTMRKLTPDYLEALRRLLDSEVLYTAERLRNALAEETGIVITTDHLRELISREGYSWKRTKRSVAHSRDPEVFESRREALWALEKKGGIG